MSGEIGAVGGHLVHHDPPTTEALGLGLELAARHTGVEGSARTLTLDGRATAGEGSSHIHARAAANDGARLGWWASFAGNFKRPARSTPTLTPTRQLNAVPKSPISPASLC